MSASIPVIGVAGWKNAGKTTLIVKLVKELSARGYRVATAKHAHHEADIDHEGTDSFRHREAGAVAVALITGKRWALMHELGSDPEPALADILPMFSDVDLVIVEGFKNDPIAKIEVRRGAKSAPLPASDDIVAIASDGARDASGKPHFHIDNAAAIADFLMERFGLAGRTGGG
jgi:molybdopterin-guanine dinucleotide biosynthesis protein B